MPTMPIWLFAVLVGLTDLFSTAMFLQIESLAVASTFSQTGAMLALLYGAVGSYLLARLRFYGSNQEHLRSLDVGNLYPFLVTFQVVVLKFFGLRNGFIPYWNPSPDLQNMGHVVSLILFLIGIFGMTYFRANSH
jgi:hypothetical protein